MTREEAIEAFRGLSGVLLPREYYREAIQMAIEALKAQADLQPTCNNLATDTISRRAAIELADELKDDLPDDERTADAVMAHNEGILEYQTALSKLSSAQPERKTGKWIGCQTAECSERGHIYLAFLLLERFCPNCGAKMEVERENRE